MNIYRHPALLLALIGICGLTGCHGSAHKPSRRAASCRLQVSGQKGGRAVVTYDDATGNPKMTAAISTEVAAWNGSGAAVVLEPSTSSPAITFRAVTAKPTFPPCDGTAPRTVTVQLSTTKWNAPANTKGSIKDPAGAIAHDIGRVLGLATAGSCPSLTSAAACPHRRETPGRTQLQTLERLYGSASPSATP